MEGIHRSQKDRIIFGVCGGLAEYFDISPFLVRLLFVLFVLIGGAGIPLYLILAVLMPGEENSAENNFGEEVKKRTKELAKEIKKTRFWVRSVRNIIGIIIILLGLNFLLSEFFNFNIFASPVWKAICALLIIFIGIKILEK